MLLTILEWVGIAAAIVVVTYLVEHLYEEFIEKLASAIVRKLKENEPFDRR